MHKTFNCSSRCTMRIKGEGIEKRIKHFKGGAGGYSNTKIKTLKFRMAHTEHRLNLLESTCLALCQLVLRLIDNDSSVLSPGDWALVTALEQRTGQATGVPARLTSSAMRASLSTSDATSSSTSVSASGSVCATNVKKTMARKLPPTPQKLYPAPAVVAATQCQTTNNANHVQSSTPATLYFNGSRVPTKSQSIADRVAFFQNLAAEATPRRKLVTTFTATTSTPPAARQPTITRPVQQPSQRRKQDDNDDDEDDASNVPIAKDVPDDFASVSSAPATTPVAECPVCIGESDVPLFRFDGCEHDGVCCRACQEADCVACIESNADVLQCVARCGSPLRYAEVRDLLQTAMPAAFKRWASHRRESLVLSAHRPVVWCAGLCGTLVPVSGARWAECSVCSTRTCVAHERKGSAFTYVEGLLVQPSACCDGMPVDTASAELLAKVTRPCPGCKAPIMKNGGCWHMTCSQCRHEFYWCCGRRYRDREETQQHNRDPACQQELRDAALALINE